jgi:hypothetical protein
MYTESTENGRCSRLSRQPPHASGFTRGWAMSLVSDKVAAVAHQVSHGISMIRSKASHRQSRGRERLD